MNLTQHINDINFLLYITKTHHHKSITMKLQFTSSLIILCLMLLTLVSHAQVLNDNINYQVRSLSYSITNDDDNGDEEILFEFNLVDDDGNRVATDVNNQNKECILFGGTCYNGCSKTQTKNLLTKINSSSKGYDWTMESWETDGDENCSNADNATSYKRTHGFRDPSNASIGFWNAFGINQSNSASAELNEVWRYTNGNTSGSPLDFGTLEHGDSKIHRNNSNRSAPEGASSYMGYTNQWRGAGIWYHNGNDIFYRFKITGKSKRVTIETISRYFDTRLMLSKASDPGRPFAFNDNDDRSRQSEIVADLGPDTYLIIVKGKDNTYEGEFGIDINVVDLPVSAGTITATSPTLICDTNPYSKINNTVSAHSLAHSNNGPLYLSTTKLSYNAGAVSYKWQMAIGDDGFDDINDSGISGATAANLPASVTRKMPDLSEAISKKVRFRRIATIGGNIASSNIVEYNFQSSTAVKGSISLSGSNTIKEGDDPGIFISTDNGSVTPGPPSYQWQKNITNDADANFVNISGATSASYDLGGLSQTTWFRRQITDGCGDKTASTIPIKITVYPANGVVSGRVSTLSGGQGAGISGVKVTATPKPGLIGAVTKDILTASDGTYTIDGLYYGATSWDYDVIPELAEHGFKFDVLQGGSPAIPVTITLSSSDPVEDGVNGGGLNFIDTTGYNISGRIVQKYNSDDVPGDETFGKNSVIVKLLIGDGDGNFTPTNAVDTTDNNGDYTLFAATAGIYKVVPEYSLVIMGESVDHSFNPIDRTLNVSEEATGADFEDQTRRIFKGIVADGCGKGVGTLEFTLQFEEDPLGQNKFVLNHDNATDTFAFILPARNYTDFTFKVLASDPAFNNPTNALAHMEAQLDRYDNFSANLSFRDTVVSLRYLPKPIITFEGIPSAIAACVGQELEGTALEGIPRIEDSETYPDFQVKVWERLGVGVDGCPLNTGYIKVNSGGTSNGLAYPVIDGVLKDEDGSKWLLAGGVPDLIAPHIVNTSFQVFDHEGINQPVSKPQPFIVTGGKSQGKSFVSVSPSIPMMVLHDPPTDKGWASISAGEIISGTFRTGFIRNIGEAVFVKGKVGIKTSLGIGVSSENEAYVQATAEGQITRNISEEGEQVFTLETNREFRTSDNLVGEDADIFVGAAIDKTYSLDRILSIDTNTCVFDEYERYRWQPDSISTTFAYNVYGIKNVVIPELEDAQIANDRLADTDPNKQPDFFFTSALKSWNDMLAENQKNKRDAIDNGIRYITASNISLNGGNAITDEITFDTLKANTYINVVQVEEKIGVETKVEVAGNGGEGGAAFVGFHQFHPLGAEPKSNGSRDTTNRRTVTFHLEDDDADDKFSIAIHKDPTYGTPIFASNGSNSSCPYNEWDPADPDRKTLSFELSPVGAVQVDNGNPLGEVFKFKIKNTSPSINPVDYIVFPDSRYNVNFAEIRLNNQAVSEIDILDVDKGATTQEISVIIVPSAVATSSNHTIRIRVAPACNGISHQNSNEFQFIDFCVSFPSDCSPIKLVSPANNEVINIANDNKVKLLMKGYNKSRLENVQLRYRSFGDGDWFNGPTYSQAELPDDVTGLQTDWDISNLADGLYDVALVVECGPGFVKNGSDIVTIIVDRTKPMIFGTPSPVDDDYDQSKNDEISIAFTESVCSDGHSDATAQLIDLYTNEVLSVNITCFDNVIKIVDVGALQGRPASFYRVVLNGVTDLRGNPADEYKWVFAVGNPSPAILACIDDLYISNNNSDQNAISISSYSAKFISSDGSVPNFGETVYTAEEFVNLQQGFEVNVGGEFIAQIGDCLSDNPCSTVLSSELSTDAPGGNLSWVINELSGCANSVLFDPNKTLGNADIWVNIGAVESDKVNVVVKSNQAQTDPNQSNEFSILLSIGANEFGIGNYSSSNGNTFKMTLEVSYGMDTNNPNQVKAKIRLDPLEQGL